MEWSDEGIVLSARKHGESAAIIGLLTRDHGRHAGLVRGGAGSRARGVYQPGNQLRATWRARLAEHLGNYACELVRSRAAALLDRAGPLEALSAAAAVADAALPEREPHPEVYDGFLALLDALDGPGWAVAYVLWELDLLAQLGFGLDLGSCAATGANDGLIYVSPRSGRAVSAAAGEAWRDRLLPLPPFLRPDANGAMPAPDEIVDGLRLTGHFLEACVFQPEERRLPAARERLVDCLRRMTTISA